MPPKKKSASRRPNVDPRTLYATTSTPSKAKVVESESKPTLIVQEKPTKQSKDKPNSPLTDESAKVTKIVLPKVLEPSAPSLPNGVSKSTLPDLSLSREVEQNLLQYLSSRIVLSRYKNYSEKASKLNYVQWEKVSLNDIVLTTEDGSTNEYMSLLPEASFLLVPDRAFRCTLNTIWGAFHELVEVLMIPESLTFGVLLRILEHATSPACSWVQPDPLVLKPNLVTHAPTPRPEVHPHVFALLSNAMKQYCAPSTNSDLSPVSSSTAVPERSSLGLLVQAAVEYIVFVIPPFRLPSSIRSHQFVLSQRSVVIENRSPETESDSFSQKEDDAACIITVGTELNNLSDLTTDQKETIQGNEFSTEKLNQICTDTITCSNQGILGGDGDSPSVNRNDSNTEVDADVDADADADSDTDSIGSSDSNDSSDSSDSNDSSDSSDSSSDSDDDVEPPLVLTHNSIFTNAAAIDGSRSSSIIPTTILPTDIFPSKDGILYQFTSPAPIFSLSPPTKPSFVETFSYQGGTSDAILSTSYLREKWHGSTPTEELFEMCKINFPDVKIVFQYSLLGKSTHSPLRPRVWILPSSVSSSGLSHGSAQMKAFPKPKSKAISAFNVQTTGPQIQLPQRDDSSRVNDSHDLDLDHPPTQPTQLTQSEKNQQLKVYADSLPPPMRFSLEPTHPNLPKIPPKLLLLLGGRYVFEQTWNSQVVVGPALVFGLPDLVARNESEACGVFTSLSADRKNIDKQVNGDSTTTTIFQPGVVVPTPCFTDINSAIDFSATLALYALVATLAIEKSLSFTERADIYLPKGRYTTPSSTISDVSSAVLKGKSLQDLSAISAISASTHTNSPFPKLHVLSDEEIKAATECAWPPLAGRLTPNVRFPQPFKELYKILEKAETECAFFAKNLSLATKQKAVESFSLMISALNKACLGRIGKQMPLIASLSSHAQNQTIKSQRYRDVLPDADSIRSKLLLRQHYMKEYYSKNRKANVLLQLPVANFHEKIKQSVSTCLISIIAAETGSGKTTCVPRFIFEKMVKEHSSQSKVNGEDEGEGEANGEGEGEANGEDEANEGEANGESEANDEGETNGEGEGEGEDKGAGKGKGKGKGEKKIVRTPTPNHLDGISWGQIVCAQPRRITASSTAIFVAQQLGDMSSSDDTDVVDSKSTFSPPIEKKWPARDSLVGYSVRFDHRMSPGCMLSYCTNGILLRRLQDNPLLTGVSVVVLDEVHERSLETDLLLVLLKRLVKKRAALPQSNDLNQLGPLKLVVMSATLNAKELSDYLKLEPPSHNLRKAFSIKPITVPGKTYPVTSMFFDEVTKLIDFRTIIASSQLSFSEYIRSSFSTHVSKAKMISERFVRKLEASQNTFDDYDEFTDEDEEDDIPASVSVSQVLSKPASKKTVAKPPVGDSFETSMQLHETIEKLPVGWPAFSSSWSTYFSPSHLTPFQLVTLRDKLINLDMLEIVMSSIVLARLHYMALHNTPSKRRGKMYGLKQLPPLNALSTRVADGIMKLSSSRLRSAVPKHDNWNATKDGQSLLEQALIEILGKKFNTSSGSTMSIEHSISALFPVISGAVLVFLPGIATITALQSRLLANPLTQSGLVDLHILHSGITWREQRQALMPAAPGVLRIILSTNIAETGVTIPDVSCVLDCGKEHQSVEGAGTSSMNSLQMIPISQASASQRRGRAGRTCEGLSIAMFTTKTYSSLLPFTIPQILRVPLDSTILRFLASGVDCPFRFCLELLSPPPIQSVSDAVSSLIKSNCIALVLNSTTEEARKGALQQPEGANAQELSISVNKIGELAVDLPLSPSAARFLVHVAQVSPLALNAAIMIAAGETLEKPFKQSKFRPVKTCLSDHLQIASDMEAWQRMTKTLLPGKKCSHYSQEVFTWMSSCGGSLLTLKQFLEVRDQIVETLLQHNIISSTYFNESIYDSSLSVAEMETLTALLSHLYPSNYALLYPHSSSASGGPPRFQGKKTVAYPIAQRLQEAQVLPDSLILSANTLEQTEPVPQVLLYSTIQKTSHRTFFTSLSLISPLVVALLSPLPFMKHASENVSTTSQLDDMTIDPSFTKLIAQTSSSLVLQDVLDERFEKQEHVAVSHDPFQTLASLFVNDWMIYPRERIVRSPDGIFFKSSALTAILIKYFQCD